MEGVTEIIVNKRLVAKSYYDRKAKTLLKLDIDQPVLVRPHRLGKQQVTTGVCAKQTSPRSYNVVEVNRVVRRNRRDLNIIPFHKPQAPEIDLGPEEPPSSVTQAPEIDLGVEEPPNSVTDQRQQQLASRQSTSANQARTMPDSANTGQKQCQRSCVSRDGGRQGALSGKCAITSRGRRVKPPKWFADYT